MTASVSAARPLTGKGMELQSIAAVVVGGVALTGGSGNMFQAFYGLHILGLLSNALNMAGVSSFLQGLVVGIVILLAVIIDRLRSGASVCVPVTLALPPIVLDGRPRKLNTDESRGTAR